MDLINLSQSDSSLPVSYHEKRKQVRRASKSNATKLAIEKHWKQFTSWCNLHQVQNLPAVDETVEAYLIFLMDQQKKVSTIEQAKWAIDSVHRLEKLQPPGTSLVVNTAIKGIRRMIGSKQNRKEAITIEHLANIEFGSDLIKKRDKALLLIGFAGGFRRSELSNMDLHDVIFLDFGCRIEIPFSKTNQEGKEEFVDIVFAKEKGLCPVNALMDWIDSSGIQSGKLFRSITKGRTLGKSLSTVSIGNIVKNIAVELGLNPDNYGGHSLRAGCATYLLEKDVSVNLVAKQLRHKKIDTTLRYDRSLTSKTLKGIY